MAFKVLLFVLVFFLGTSFSWAKERNVPVETLPVFYQDELVKVVSDTKLTEAEALKIADLVKQAMKFDKEQLGWDNITCLDKPIMVGVLTDKFQKQYFDCTFMGGSFGPNFFAMADDYATEKAFYGVVAHEITHTFVGRLFGKFNQRTIGWSAVWGEGIALNMGKRFRLATQKDIYPSGHVYVNKKDESLTGEDARFVFSCENSKDLTKDQKIKYDSLCYPVGQQFIEFIRIHLNGKGCPDTIKIIANILTDMAATHKPFNDEFKEKFGTEYSIAQEQFIKHLITTQTDPEKRFAGTIFEPNRGRPNM